MFFFYLKDVQFGIKNVRVFKEVTMDANKRDAVNFLNLLKYLGLNENGESIIQKEI